MLADVENQKEMMWAVAVVGPGDREDYEWRLRGAACGSAVQRSFHYARGGLLFPSLSPQSASSPLLEMILSECIHTELRDRASSMLPEILQAGRHGGCFGGLVPLGGLQILVHVQCKFE